MTAPEERPDGHPDLADLEALRTGEAPPEVARHVAGCDECRAALEEIKALAPGLASIEAPAVEIPAEIDRRVAAAIDERVAEIRPPRRRRKIVRWAVPLAAADLRVASGLFRGHSREGGGQGRSRGAAHWLSRRDARARR